MTPAARELLRIQLHDIREQGIERETLANTYAWIDYLISQQLSLENFYMMSAFLESIDEQII
jgi:hypothetical protein